MSPIDQVLAAAKAIALSGHTPNLALVKARLSKKLPIPVIIQGLKEFKAIPKERWSSLTDLDMTHSVINEAPVMEPNIDLQQLLNTIGQLSQQIEQLTSRVHALENKVNE
ncbi:hypothetical protein [Shewanella sp. SR44-3]|uniref:hypothetical protein n=1 Tax=Shewanella sp. SR44-3 TaxID=2760936 RepID=UPI0015F8A77A|nr:hypothetical protein [Shewanella sp. SR44-3]MBB1270559.1 hypothetical protein [Shewanella sp. SR44-3]